VTSNYVWRGVTQTNDEAAIQGGIDYTAASNWYAGIWTSSLGGGNSYELDWYGGFRGKIGNVPFDAGVTYYQYPIEASGNDFTEIYGKFDFSVFSAQAAFTLDKDGTSQDNDLYLSIGTDIEIRRQLYLNLLFGMYEFDAPGAEDYKHFHIALKKEDFVFALDKNDKDRPIASDPGEMRISVSWERNFDL
jgi:uncharacterized protein (TIGR02001 family)